MSWRALPILFGVACNAPAPPASTGGTDEPVGACGRGVAAVHTEYQGSVNVALVAWDGRVLSPSFISSATQNVGLSAPLGSDVVLPTRGAIGSEIALIDRYPASIVTWVDVASAKVRAQLPVGDGSPVNPHDLVTVSETKAYVTRFEGNDLVAIDPSIPEIVGYVDLAPAMAGELPEYLASPGRAVAHDGVTYVVLEGYAPGFVNGSAPSRVVAVDPETDAVTDVLVLDGAHGCGGLALSPDGSELALACAGNWTGAELPDPATSHLVRIGVGSKLSELGRVSASELGGAPFGFGVDYAAPGTLVAVRFGDTLVEVDVASGQSRELLTAPRFELSDVRCASECGVCFATNAASGRLHRFAVSGGRLGEPVPILADSIVGLPPRWLGRF